MRNVVLLVLFCISVILWSLGKHGEMTDAIRLWKRWFGGEWTEERIHRRIEVVSAAAIAITILAAVGPHAWENIEKLSGMRRPLIIQVDPVADPKDQARFLTVEVRRIPAKPDVKEFSLVGRALITNKSEITVYVASTKRRIRVVENGETHEEGIIDSPTKELTPGESAGLDFPFSLYAIASLEDEERWKAMLNDNLVSMTIESVFVYGEAANELDKEKTVSLKYWVDRGVYNFPRP